MFMMVNRSLVKIIRQIGLTDKHALVYASLIAKNSITPLGLARETKINRTSLYRYLEELRGKGLAELVLGDKSNKYRANPEGLNQYLMSEESRVESLKSTIPTLVAELSKQKVTEGSEVKYYQGVQGLKQMLWNVVSSGKEYIGLGYQDWNTSVGKSFAEKLRAKNMETGASSREILNHPENTFEYTGLGETYSKVFEHRAIDPKILEIKHDTYIYDDVFAYYYHYQGEYFGVEIHNKEIARTERQMFEILWQIAK
jgi:sugar-specific transcriptional regulator TrmB